ncbi:hypothetical protein BH09VER1_BH09VER1_28300 [soil metagenome]
MPSGPAIPANQLAVLFRHWPFEILPFYNASDVDPDSSGVSEETLRKWFYGVRKWKLEMSGTVEQTVLHSFPRTTVWSGSQEIWGQYSAYQISEAGGGDDEDPIITNVEVGPAANEREIFEGLLDEADEGRFWGFRVDDRAMIALGNGWGIQSVTTVHKDDGDEVQSPVTRFIGRFLRYVIQDPNHRPPLTPTLYIPYLAFTWGGRDFHTIESTFIQYVNPAFYRIGTLTVGGELTLPLFIANPSLDTDTYSGTLTVTLDPVATDGFWEYRDKDGNNPRWNKDTGAKLGDW